MAVQVDISKVRSVYSGKPGCCCGCRGKHTYSSSDVKAAERARGYAITLDEVSDRTVSRIVNLINKGEGKVEDCGSFVSLDTDTRVYIAYLE